MAGQLRQAGNEVVATAEGADIVIINSCAVTVAATSDSRQKIRQAYHQGVGHIIVTGCWATLYPEQAVEFDGVSQVVSNLEKMNIPTQLINVEDTMMEFEPIARRPLPGIHKRTRAFIKVQDGCDNFCTYCVTRLARGKGTSLPKKEILRAINQALLGGTREIVLTGVNLGSWGRDLEGSKRFSDLIKFLLDHSDAQRIRLSSIEPWDLDSSLLKLWDNARLCPHFHLPLQTGSSAVLHRMARNTTPDKFRQLVFAARERIPNLAITTDIIVGFPGESEIEFEESLEFINEMNFSGGHVFRYSPREGTAAARMVGQITSMVAKERAKKIRDILDKGEFEFNSLQVGNLRHVLWETSKEDKDGNWINEGLSENYARIQAKSSAYRWNILDAVKVISIENGILFGEILQE